MKYVLATMVLAGAAFAQAAPDKVAAKAPTLKQARTQWDSARTDYRRLSRFERIAIRDARSTYFQSPCGKLVQPSLKTAAALLTKAAAEATKQKNVEFAKLAGDAATAANRIAGKAKATEGLLAAWKKAAKTKADPEITKAFEVLAEGDPRQRALKANVATINKALASLKKLEAPKAAQQQVAAATSLTAMVAKCLNAVPAKRLAPPVAAPTQTPT